MTSMLTLRPRNKFLLDVDMSKAGRLDYQDCNGQRGTEVEATRPTFAQEPALLSRSVEEIEAEGYRWCTGCQKYLFKTAFYKRSDNPHAVRSQCIFCYNKREHRKLPFKQRRKR